MRLTKQYLSTPAFIRIISYFILKSIYFCLFYIGSSNVFLAIAVCTGGVLLFFTAFSYKKIFPGGNARKETRPEAIDFASKLRRF